MFVLRLGMEEDHKSVILNINIIHEAFNIFKHNEN